MQRLQSRLPTKGRRTYSKIRRVSGLTLRASATIEISVSFTPEKGGKRRARVCRRPRTQRRRLLDQGLLVERAVCGYGRSHTVWGNSAYIVVQYGSLHGC